MKLCSYGCEREAKFYFPTVVRWCCSKSIGSCPEIRRRNKESHIGKNKGRRPWNKELTKETSKILEESGKKISRSLLGHIPWNKDLTKETSKILEEMGKKVSKSNKGRVGPNKGRKFGPHSKEWNEKIGESLKGQIPWSKGKNLKKESIEKQRQTMIEKWKSPNSVYNSEKYRELLSESMKRGRSVYMNHLITNPSKPQVEFFIVCCKILPRPIHNFPIYRVGKGKKSYNVDVADSSLGIILEFDGSYWHKDKKYDRKRQKEIEEDGWKFLRYTNYVPTEEQLVKDIRKLL